MKKSVVIYYLAICFVSISSCKKDAPGAETAATLTVVNTVTQGQAVKLSTNTISVNNNAFAHIGIRVGEPNVYVFPVNDSLHPYYMSSKLSVIAGEIYTLFLGGTATAVETILTKENFSTRTDSTMGVRFINLAPGSPAVKITLSSSPTVSEFDNIQYKQVSEFRSFSVNSINSSYTFQVRRTDNAALITSITLSGTNLATGLARFKNVTLVLRGIVGGTPTAGLTRVNHY